MAEKMLQDVVELLFDDVPFSKDREDVKEELCATLEEKYQDTDGQSQIYRVKNIVEEAASLSERYDALKEGEITPKKEAKRLFKRHRLFLGLETLCAVGAIYLFSNLFWFYFVWQILGGIGGAFLTVGFFFLERYRRKFVKKERLFSLKFDGEGEKYIREFYDKYVKSTLNSAFLCLAAVGYLICLLEYSVSGEMIVNQLPYWGLALAAFVFLLVKNGLCYATVCRFYGDLRGKNFRSHLLYFTLASTGYWLLGAYGLLRLFGMEANFAVAFWIIFAIGRVGSMTYAMTLRRALTFRNLKRNYLKISAAALALVLALSYQVMAWDTWLLQPYINSVAPVPYVADEISYNESNGVYTVTTEKEDFKILQLTDIHLGGSILSVDQDVKALKAVRALVNHTTPDLIIVTGDLVFPMGIASFSLNNRTPIMQFAAFMRNLGIPWAFTYGNHDTEAISVYDKQEISQTLQELSYQNSQNFLYPTYQPAITGRNNQLIEIRAKSGEVKQALFLLDSNDYVEGGSINEYDYIHDDQVAWYEEHILRLNEEAGKTVPSMAFFHMPLQEYRTAFEILQREGVLGADGAPIAKNSSEVKYFYGEIGETVFNKICCSEHPSKLFDRAVALGSTKAMFCGHDHYNNLSVEYRGIRLTYGYSIDYLVMSGIEHDTKQRGATLITVDREGDFTVDGIKLVDIQ